MAPGALTSFNPDPVPGFPDTRAAVVRVAWSPLRRDPSHRSEMTSQLVLGEVVELLDQPASAWLTARGSDGYEGHVTAGALRPVSEADAAAWTAAADGFSLGTDLHYAAESAAGRAPWGARLARGGDGGFLVPDGDRVLARRPERIVFGPERALAYEADAAAAVRTARAWIGTPYHWGGRIRAGADCSGFVQAVYALHGLLLPRDSRDQFEAGPRLPDDADHAERGRPGDLWFFAWDGGQISHVGICLGDGEMIHASQTRGAVAVDRIGEGEFGRRLAAGLVGSTRPERGS
ncbi:MAG: NlpC/P60 family protein [Gemmatimonadota bacterium]